MMFAWWTALPATHRRSSCGGVWASGVVVGWVVCIWAAALKVEVEVAVAGVCGSAFKARGEYHCPVAAAAAAAPAVAAADGDDDDDDDDEFVYSAGGVADSQLEPGGPTLTPSSFSSVSKGDNVPR